MLGQYPVLAVPAAEPAEVPGELAGVVLAARDLQERAEEPVVLVAHRGREQRAQLRLGREEAPVEVGHRPGRVGLQPGEALLDHAGFRCHVPAHSLDLVAWHRRSRQVGCPAL
ncbi:Uncharacterised protein [Mycobacterium tuberculosis]|nr:Uncharacterised protein [Mycobacterium tuberculosis]